MTHKVHPKSFRLRNTIDWQSRWFERKKYAESLREDFIIRDFLESKLKESGLESIEIERFVGKVNIIINSARPGLIIGRGGSGIEIMKKALEKLLKKSVVKNTEQDARKKEIRIEIREVKNPWESAALTAQWVAQQLERRMPYRRIMKQALTKVMANKSIEGAKIEVAGRLGGADIARREKLRMGRLPLQTLRANIDYSLKEAKTTYGMIGVKVWLYKGDRFE